MQDKTSLHITSVGEEPDNVSRNSDCQSRANPNDLVFDGIAMQRVSCSWRNGYPSRWRSWIHYLERLDEGC